MLLASAHALVCQLAIRCCNRLPVLDLRVIDLNLYARITLVANRCLNHVGIIKLARCLNQVSRLSFATQVVVIVF